MVKLELGKWVCSVFGMMEAELTFQCFIKVVDIELSFVQEIELLLSDV